MNSISLKLNSYSFYRDYYEQQDTLYKSYFGKNGETSGEISSETVDESKTLDSGFFSHPEDGVSEISDKLLSGEVGQPSSLSE